VLSATSIPPPQRHWYDRIVDAVLGEDTESPHTRFALICRNCFTHNGLVRGAEWEDTRKSSFNLSLLHGSRDNDDWGGSTEYVCMKCGHLNPSPRQKQLMVSQASRLQSLSPQRHTNGAEDDSPAVSVHTATDDERTSEQTGKMEVDES